MSASDKRRWPGVRFEVAPPRLPEVLPRMDVAAFVGVAASGPIDVPVAIEDIGHYHALFGEDAPIAWDAELGEFVYAKLASSVRAFFRNGGVRCWVVRVAGSEAQSNTFVVPGLGRYSIKNRVFDSTAHALARSEGSFSDALKVSAALDSRPLTLVEGAFDKGSLVVRLGAPSQLVIGDLLRISFGPSPYILYFPIESVEPIADQDGAWASAAPRPLSMGATLRLKSEHPLWILGTDPAPQPVAAPSPVPTAFSLCEKLAFELWWRRGDNQPAHIGGLGFCPGHPRYFAALPRDFDLYADADAPDLDPKDPRRPKLDDVDPYQALRSEAAEPRIPLAGPGGLDGIFLPLKMELFPSRYSTCEVAPGSERRRDGLSTLAAELFLDSRLIGSGVETLSAQADFLRYKSPDPQRLRGIFALFGCEEVTLVAVPDAVLRSWRESKRPESVPPLSPDPNPPVPEGLCGATHRADRSFSDRDRRPPPRPTLTAPNDSDASGSFQLSFSNVPDAQYELEESLNPDHVDGVRIYAGPDQGIDIRSRTPGEYYYRVRAVKDKLASAWSDGRLVTVAPPISWVVSDLSDYSATTLLAVQRALLRLCAARGDLFAILTLPEHYREDEAIAHANLLRSPLEVPTEGVAPLGFAESSALSFGALYHPWLIERQENQPTALRRSPPDGAAVGVIAKRAIARGAWLAPANEPLAGVVALDPTLGRLRTADLFQSRVNLFQQEPQGFLALSADTLSLDEELVPISVRRLLVLLRRAALRLGATHVFEPNDNTLRRDVERSFESLLGQLYARGAFAGRSPESAYQVVTGDASQAQSSAEPGRFIVELRVAPSLPLDFLTVRLVQSGDRGQVTEER